MEQGDPLIYAYLGETYALNNDFDKSIEIYEKGITIDSDCPDLWRNYGELLLDAGDFDKARKMLKKAQLQDIEQKDYVIPFSIISTMVKMETKCP